MLGDRSQCKSGSTLRSDLKKEEEEQQLLPGKIEVSQEVAHELPEALSRFVQNISHTLAASQDLLENSLKNLEQTDVSSIEAIGLDSAFSLCTDLVKDMVVQLDLFENYVKYGPSRQENMMMRDLFNPGELSQQIADALAFNLMPKHVEVIISSPFEGLDGPTHDH
jgi:hypothetical protein